MHKNKIAQGGSTETNLPDSLKVDDIAVYKAKIRQNRRVFILDDSISSCEMAESILAGPYGGRTSSMTDSEKAIDKLYKLIISM